MMLESFKHASWLQLRALRNRVSALRDGATLAESAQGFSEIFASSFESVVLARVFAVLQPGLLPPREREFAAALAAPTPLAEQTRILSLLGTRGRQRAWNERANSEGHLAIPLLNSSSVRAAPMIAKVLGDLQIDLSVLDRELPLAPRKMLVGRSHSVFVPDALTAVDEEGRSVIPARRFVEENAVRSVFGMGGAYIDGTVVVAIVFCAELLDREVADRFTSLIDAFKVATADLVKSRMLW